MCSARWLMREHGAAGGLEHLAGAGVDLAAHQERDEHLGVVAEVVAAAGEVVLVAAVGVAGGVGVVLEEVDRAADALLPEALLGADQELLEDALAGLVVDDQLADRVALGRGVLGVAADVEVEAGAVGEEHVGAAAPRHDPAEQVAGDLVGAQAALAARGAGDPVLVLEAEDAALHGATVPAGRGRGGTTPAGRRCQVRRRRPRSRAQLLSSARTGTRRRARRRSRRPW